MHQTSCMDHLKRPKVNHACQWQTWQALMYFADPYPTLIIRVLHQDAQGLIRNLKCGYKIVENGQLAAPCPAIPFDETGSSGAKVKYFAARNQINKLSNLLKILNGIQCLWVLKSELKPIKITNIKTCIN